MVVSVVFTIAQGIRGRRRTELGGRMADFTATAISEGDHWVIDVDGVGTAQAEDFDDIEATAVDLVTAVTHSAPADVHVQMRIL